MAFSVRFSARARAQIRAINMYITEAAGPAVAEDYVGRIVQRCLGIAAVPRGGTPRPELGHGLRSIPFERQATVLYRVARDEVVIVGVFYGGQDIAARMKRRSR